MQRDVVNMSAERADRFEGRAKRQAERVIRKIIGIALLLAICMWAFIGWSLGLEFDAARAVGRTEAYNLTAAFSFELSAAIDAAGAALQRIEDAAKAVPSTATQADFQAALRREAAMAGKPVRIAGPDGQRVFSSLDPDSGPSDFSETAHFIAHRDRRSAGLSVDSYVKDAAGPFIHVSRRLEAADGHFAGEAMLLLPTRGLFTLIQQMEMGSGGLMAVVGPDGVVLAGYDQESS